MATEIHEIQWLQRYMRYTITTEIHEIHYYHRDWWDTLLPQDWWDTLLPQRLVGYTITTGLVGYTITTEIQDISKMRTSSLIYVSSQDQCIRTKVADQE
jgi:hypothetical protein